MNRKTAFVFHALMKNGWIDRREDPAAWEAYLENDVPEELNDLGIEIGFDILRKGDRLYLIPTQDNDLFLKNNVDYRRDIKASSNDVKVRDLYLLNYMAVYILYLFFNGDGNDPASRDFMTKEAFIEEFTVHCSSVTASSPQEEQKDYSENFRNLAEDWLSKLEGQADELQFKTRYGCLNRLLQKFKADALFEVNEQNEIRPTRKLSDLMPYFLRKDRITEINNWIEKQKEADNAADK